MELQNELILWIARDKDGELCLYTQEPERNGDSFWYGNYPYEHTYIKLCNLLFPEVTWENSPRKIKIDLI